MADADPPAEAFNNGNLEINCTNLIIYLLYESNGHFREKSNCRKRLLRYGARRKCSNRRLAERGKISSGLATLLVVWKYYYFLYRVCMQDFVKWQCFSLIDEDQVIKTYSAGTAASQVHYEGAELRIIDDDEPEDEPEEANVASAKSHVNRSAKRTGQHARIASGSHIRPRSICSSGELTGKTSEEGTDSVWNK